MADDKETRICELEEENKALTYALEEILEFPAFSDGGLAYKTLREKNKEALAFGSTIHERSLWEVGHDTVVWQVRDILEGAGYYRF
jgi:hypothetical protein